MTGFNRSGSIPGSSPIAGVSGTPGNGNLLTMSMSAKWTAGDIQWYKYTASSGLTSAIGGATSATYLQTGLLPGDYVYPVVHDLSNLGPQTAIPAAPVFSVAPQLTAAPVVGVPMTFTNGVFSGASATMVIGIRRDGVLIATGGYTPTLSDQGHDLAVENLAANAGGADTATSVWQTVAAAPDAAYTSLPFIMSDTPTTTLRVRINPGVLAAGVAHTWQVKMDGANATGTGNSNATYYIPVAGDAGKAMTVDFTPTGPGSYPVYTTPAQTVVAKAAATGQLRAISAANRWPMNRLLNSSGATRKMASNLNHVIGSGNVLSIRPIYINYYAPGTTTFNAALVGVGNVINYDGAYAVYNNVVVQATVGSAGGINGAGGGSTSWSVPNGSILMGDDIPSTQFGSAVDYVQGDPFLFKPRVDLPNGSYQATGLATDLSPNEHWLYDPGANTLNNWATTLQLSVSGGGVRPDGTCVILIGTFASGDPRVIGFIGDSRCELGGSSSMAATVARLLVQQAPIANINISKSSGQAGIFNNSPVLQALCNYFNIAVPEVGVNSAGGANIGNANDLTALDTTMYGLINANAVAGAGLRTMKIARTSLGFSMVASGFSNTLSSTQVPNPRFQQGGDVYAYYRPNCLAQVGVSTAAYLDYNGRYSLSTDFSTANGYKVQAGVYNDGLHQSRSQWWAWYARPILMGL